MNTNQHIVDEYGMAKARLAELEDSVAAIRQQIIAMGISPLEGESFRATVSIAPRSTVDWKAIAFTLRPSFAYPENRWSDEMVAMVKTNTSSKDVTTVTCKARIGVAA